MEMKFVLHYSGKQQMVTYNMVRNHIVKLIQKTFKHGSDIAKLIFDDADMPEIGSGPPMKVVISVPSSIRSDAEALELQLAQSGHYIDYRE